MRIETKNFKGFDPKKTQGKDKTQSKPTPVTLFEQFKNLPPITKIQTPKTLASSFSKEFNEITAKLKQPDPKFQEALKQIQAPNPQIQEAIKILNEPMKMKKIQGPEKHMEKTEFPELREIQSLESKFRTEHLQREFKKVNAEFERRQKEIDSKPKKVYPKFAESVIQQQQALEPVQPLIEQQQMVSNLAEIPAGLDKLVKQIGSQ